jgi:hypothetical protein
MGYEEGKKVYHVQDTANWQDPFQTRQGIAFICFRI